MHSSEKCVTVECPQCRFLHTHTHTHTVGVHVGEPEPRKWLCKLFIQVLSYFTYGILFLWDIQTDKAVKHIIRMGKL